VENVKILLKRQKMECRRRQKDTLSRRREGEGEAEEEEEGEESNGHMEFRAGACLGVYSVPLSIKKKSSTQ
jgi:hypothetical protein